MYFKGYFKFQVAIWCLIDDIVVKTHQPSTLFLNYPLVNIQTNYGNPCLFPVRNLSKMDDVPKLFCMCATAYSNPQIEKLETSSRHPSYPETDL